MLPIRFATAVIGEPLGPIVTDVTDVAVRRYCEDWTDPHPWYLQDSPFQGRVAPPAFMAGLTAFHLLRTRYDVLSTIGTKSEHQNYAPLKVGRQLITKGSITEKYIKRGLEYVVVESTSHDDTGQLIRRSKDVVLLGLEKSSLPDTPRNTANEHATTPMMQSSRWRIGEQIPATEKQIYQRALQEERFRADSIHNDDYTKAKGYPGALISAYVLCGYMSEPLVKFFGESWFTTGNIALAFVGQGVQQGDAVRCGGSVSNVMQQGNAYRVTLDIWMEKRSGVRPVVGQASALLH